MENVTARKCQTAGADLRQLRMSVVKAGHVMRRIAGPALAADVLIEPAIAVGDDVESGDFLLPSDTPTVRRRTVREICVVTIASRKERVPRFSVYQLGRGNDPITVVGITFPAVALSILISP